MANSVYFTVAELPDKLFGLFFIETGQKFHMMYEKSSSRERLISFFENEVYLRYGFLPFFLPIPNYASVLSGFSYQRRMEVLKTIGC